MQEWPLTGRARELEAIAQLLEGVGTTGFAVIGAAGVGKTRLAREAAMSARLHGWTVRWVAGTAAAQSVPLGAFTEWTDQVDVHPLQLVKSVIEAVTAAADHRPILVVLDDAHKLDDLSSFVVHQLVLHKAATVIATIRAGENVPDAVTALWKDGHLSRLDLEPLSRAESDALLETVLGGRVASETSNRVWQLARGNAMYLHEIVSHSLNAGRLISRRGEWVWDGATTISAALSELVELQLRAVEQPVLDVLDAVALAEPLELTYLAALADPVAIEEAERRRLIAVRSNSPTDVVHLGHPLFGEVRLATAGRWRLARLRGRIVEAMGAPTGAPDAVRLALLWLESDLPADGHVLAAGAQTALLRLDVLLAEELARAAIDAGAGTPAEILLAHTLSVLSAGDEAEQLLARLTGRELPDALWSTVLTLRAANLLWTMGRPADSMAVVDDALREPTPSRRPAVFAFRAIQLASAGQPDEALRYANCVDVTTLSPLPAMMLAWARTIAYGDLGRSAQALAAGAEGAAMAAAQPEAAFQGVGLLIFHMHVLVMSGSLAEARALAERSNAILTDVPGPVRANSVAISGWASLASGEIRSAVQSLGEALSEYKRVGSTVGSIYYFGVAYAQALALAGETDLAVDALARVQERPHGAFTLIEPDKRIASAWVAAAHGQLSQARDEAAHGAEFARAHGQAAREVLCLQAALQFGDSTRAARLADLAEHVEGPRAPLLARWGAAVAERDGVELLSVSIDLETMGDRVAAADAAAQACTLLHRSNRRGTALIAADRAARLIAACSATTPATRAAAMPLPLTHREREVALLVVKGMSNKEIAVALSLSVRTVEGHIYQACRKLEVPNRTELARALSALI